MRSFSKSNDLQSVPGNLEDAIANLTEFVVLMGARERTCQRLYGTCLYIDNFMFGRHGEKQQIIKTLLNDPGRHGAPTVLPVLGGLVRRKHLLAL